MNKNMLIVAIAVPAAIIVGWFIINNNQKDTSTLDTTTNTSNTSNETTQNGLDTCANIVEVSDISVEKDPAGDAEAWIQFSYTSSATRDLYCNYRITFMDNQGEIIRAVNTQDTFAYPSGQITNGYSDTQYQAGMTAEIVID